MKYFMILDQAQAKLYSGPDCAILFINVFSYLSLGKGI